MIDQALKVYNNPQNLLTIQVASSSVFLLSSLLQVRACFHDHRSALLRQVRGDLAALGGDAHEVGGAG